ncbi:RNA polymerase II-associated protein 3, partial [Stegodyphus mimosarum]
MSDQNVLDVQNQIRENSEDIQKYLMDLDNWEKEMRKKEEELKLNKTNDEDTFPPIRNSLSRSKKKGR